MHKYLYVLCFVLFLAAVSTAQTVKPTPGPTPPDDVVKISTNLIQVDVSVTDSKGRPVTDLKADEIEIYENGKKQDIKNFSFVSVPKAPVQQQRVKTDKNVVAPPPPVSFELRPEQVRRTIALVVDDLTMSNFSIYDIRRALKKFVDEQMQPGDLVAIIRAGAGVGALQQFTSDKNQLYAAIDRVRWSPYQGKVGYFDAMTEPEPSQAGMTTPEGGKGIRGDTEGEDEVNAFKQDVFVVGTLGALNYVIRGMKELPGRKSVLLLSEGFNMHSDDPRFLDRMRSLIDAASRASVVIYTADPRGVVFTGFTAADNVSGRNAALVTSGQAAREKALFQSRGGLAYLAERTGGKSIKGTNDLSGAIREILDDQSYYLIGYEPDGDTFDPRTRKFNTLDIKVSRPGTTVRHRSGFFGVRDRPVAEVSGRGKIYSALSSPFSLNDITLRLNALFENGSKDGSLIRTLLHVEAGDLTFKPLADGSMQTKFDLIAAAVSDNGVFGDYVNKTYTVTVKKGTYDRLIKDGFVYNVDLPIKKAGPYQLRVAIQDDVTGKVGSANQFVVVPDVKKGKLVLSGVYLENLGFDEWKSQSEAGTTGANPLSDTSLRQFKRHTVLNFGLTVYNPKAAETPGSDLTMQMRVYYGDKQVLDGVPRPIAVTGQTDLKRIAAFGSLNLGDEMLLGDYVLQIIVRDGNKDQTIATQLVPFQIVE
jgi:VWFA-related protein